MERLVKEEEMSYKNILLEKDESVAYIILNRVEIRNALNEQTMDEIIDAISLCNSDEKIKVMVIKGAGDKAFSAGGDLNNMLDNLNQSSITIQRFTSKYKTLVENLINSKKPTIAAVRGYAMAGGCGLAVVCDLTIASTKAVFAIPEITIGIWGAVISAPIARLIGLKKTMELFYTGESINAVEAERIGLINKVVDDEKLDEEVDRLARLIASKSPLAITMGREALIMTQDMEIGKALNYLRNMVTILLGSGDAKEGIGAFIDKRQPNWENR